MATAYGHRYQIETPLTQLYLLCACIFCWVIGYMGSIGFPVYGEVEASSLWNVLCQVLRQKEWAYLFGLLLLFGGAFFVHRANYALVLIRERTLLPFLLYALLASTNPDFFPLKATSFGVFCLILALYQLFTSYHDPLATDKAYNMAILIAVGSLLWVYILWFLPLFWWGMYYFRAMGIRMFAATLMGVLTVYWFLLGWCVWQADFSAFTIPIASLFKIRPLTALWTSAVDWIQFLLVAGLTFLASMHIIMHENDDSLRVRQFLSFLIALSIGSFGLFFLYEQSSEEFLEISCVPSAILIAHFFTVNRGRYVFWLFHLSVALFLILFLVSVWNFL